MERESQFCELWKKVLETPEDTEVVNLTEEQQIKLGSHVNTCPACQELFEAQEDSPAMIKKLENLNELDQPPLFVAILLKGEARIDPQEQAFAEQALADREREIAEIETAVINFIMAYPSLNPKNFGIPQNVPPRALWNVNHFLMLMARRFCRHELHGSGLQTIQILPDGAMTINQDSRIPSETCQAEAYATASNVSIAIDLNLAKKIILWLRAASQLHPQLFDPELNKLDHTGKNDFLAPWRV